MHLPTLPRRPALLTVEEVARELRLGRSKTYELLARGAIRSVRVDGSRRVLARDLDAFVEGLPDHATGDTDGTGPTRNDKPRRRS